VSDPLPTGFPAETVWLAPSPWRRPSPGTAFCCERMARAVTAFCDEHGDPWACNRATLVYNEPLDEYGILLRDRREEYVLIDNCPWCGARLPASRRDDWFDAVEAAGIEEPLSADAATLPPQFLTAEWRRTP